MVRFSSIICFALLGLSSSVIAASNAPTAEEWPQNGPELASQCQQAEAQLMQAQVVDGDADEQTLRNLDSALAQLQQQLSKAMVLADATPNQALRQQAIHCIEQLSHVEQQWLHSDAMAGIVDQLEDQTLSKQASRTLGLWLHQRGLVSGGRAKQTQQRMLFAEAGYQETLRGLRKKLRLPQQCQQGVPPEHLQRWLENDQFELPLRGSQVARFLTMPVADECRRMAWVALYSRGMPDNMMQLDMVLSQRMLWANNHGAKDYAEYQLRTQVVNSADLVGQFLTQLASNELPDSFANEQWLWSGAGKGKKLDDAAAKPADVITKVAAKLSQLGLILRPVEDNAARSAQLPAAKLWHDDVKVFSLELASSGEQPSRPLATLYFDLFGRDGKSAKPRHRAIRHGIYGGTAASSVVVTALPRTEWYGRDRRVFYRQLGQAIQHSFARAEYYALSGHAIERDYARLGMYAFESLMADDDPWLSQQQLSPQRLAKKLFRSSVALDYHRLEMANFAALQSVNQHYFSQYLKVPMPAEYTPQYALHTLISDGALYYQRLWYPAFAKLLLRCQERPTGELLQALFEPAGQQSAFATIQQVCPQINSRQQLVSQVASVNR